MVYGMNNKIRISAVAALDYYTRAIGKVTGGMPWKRIPEDMRHFKKITTGHPVIMGRVTWEEFNGKPLPNRINIIITRKENYNPGIKDEDIIVVNDEIQAIEVAINIEKKSDNIHKEIFIIGGAQIYRSLLPFCDSLYLTLINSNTDSQIKFPDYKGAGWKKIVSSRQSRDENYTYCFLVIKKE